MKLYEMTTELAALMDNIAALLDNDEMQPEAKEAALASMKEQMGELAGTHAEKCLNVACMVKNIESEVGET